MNVCMKQNVMVLAVQECREMLLILFGFGSSKIVSSSQNALPSSLVEFSLTFSCRLFTRFTYFPLPLCLIFLSLSFPLTTFASREISYFSPVESKLSAFLGERVISPVALSLWFCKDQIVLIITHNSILTTKVGQSHTTFMLQNLMDFCCSKSLREDKHDIHTQRPTCPPRWEMSWVHVHDST